jgi:hypothetical protein
MNSLLSTAIIYELHRLKLNDSTIGQNISLNSIVPITKHSLSREVEISGRLHVELSLVAVACNNEVDLGCGTTPQQLPTPFLNKNYLEMHCVLWIALSILCCEAFHPAPARSAAAVTFLSRTRLHGIIEWREQALESKYTLDVYQQVNSSPVLATIPILPFPFSDVLLQGQRTQLNLYEQRFHELFQDAMDNHCGMVGMGLLAGNGMITTLPLCEVESFSRFGAEDDWVDGKDGMGNGSIFVSIRAVGRAKIAESELLQEVPYMKAKVIELLDEDISMNGKSGLKEKSATKLIGESSPLEVASLVAGNIENLMLSLASLEHKLKEVEGTKEERKNSTVVSAKEYAIDAEEFKETAPRESDANEDPDEVMNRRIVNARLVSDGLNALWTPQCNYLLSNLLAHSWVFQEYLFMQDSNEGVEVGDNEVGDNNIMTYDDEEMDVEDDIPEGDTDEKIDRVEQFRQAFENAKETDTFGYVLPPTLDILPKSELIGEAVRTAKDLAAISWAAFCTGEKNNIARDVMKIQALDTINILQRLQLAAAMLRDEKKKCRAKLALAGIIDTINEED